MKICSEYTGHTKWYPFPAKIGITYQHGRHENGIIHYHLMSRSGRREELHGPSGVGVSNF